MFKPAQASTGEPLLHEDRFCQVETALSFKKITCFKCGLESIYKFRVRQVRRRPEIQTDPDQEIRPDHRAIWQTIPRFVEIPETLKCKRCREVVTPDVVFVY